MAVFGGNTVDRTNILSSVNDRTVSDYLYKLNEDLVYMFNNLNIDDNFSEVGQLLHAEEGSRISTLEVRADGIDMKVQDDETNYNASFSMLADLLTLEVTSPTDDVSSIKLTGDKITLKTGKFVVDAKNLSIDEEGNAIFSGTVQAAKVISSDIQGGTMQATTITASTMSASDITGGTVTAAKITGGTIRGTHISGSTIDVGRLYADDDEVYIGCFYAYTAGSGAEYLATEDQTVGMGNHPDFAFWAGSSGTNPPFAVDQEGTVYANEIYCGDSWWDGWTLTRILRWLDGRIDDLESSSSGGEEETE